MTNLKTIPRIHQTSLDLLEAAGFSNLEMLAKVSIDELTKELERANEMLKISVNTPTRSHISSWVNHARKVTFHPAENSGEDRPQASANDLAEEYAPQIDYENSFKGQVLLNDAPFGIPLPSRLLIDQQLAVADIPIAILYDQCPKNLEVIVQAKTGSHPHIFSNVKIAEGHSNRLQLDSSRIKPVEILAGKITKKAATALANQDERLSLIRTTREETNRGRNPESRRYVRGVLHNQPIKLTLAAYLTLLLVFFIFAAIISVPLLFLSSEMPEHFAWVPKWLLLFPIGLPLVGVAYLIRGMSGSCRICGQKLFLPRMCIKNKKAHHIRGLGYIIPLCIHILLFKWFRCTYCATPIRLKE